MINFLYFNYNIILYLKNNMNLSQKIDKIVQNLNNKDFKTVINSCQKLIDTKIENTVIYNLYGQAYQNLGFYEKSIPKFEKSIELNSNNYFAINNLAISLKAIEKYQLSEKTYKKCLKIKADYTIGYINYANLKEFLNDSNDAIDLYLKALKFTSGTTEAYIYKKLSRLYLSMGKLNEARKYAIKLITNYPNETSYYELFSEMADFQKDKKYFLDMESLYKNKNLNDNEIINLAFPLGQEYEKLKDFDKAFGYYKIGNKLKKKQVYYNFNDFYELCESIKKIFKKSDVINFRKKNQKKK